MKTFSQSSFIAGFIAGILVVGGAWLLGTGPGMIPAPLIDTSSSTPTATPESGAVAVSDQKAGMAVTVDSVTVPPPGVWIAVRETDGNDLGNVLGAVRVGGPRTQVSIPLLRATEPSRSYVVELYRDDNNGAFDPTVNSVYVDFGTGARVVANFKTTAE